MNQTQVVEKIEDLWKEKEAILQNYHAKTKALEFLKNIISMLNEGKIRACEKREGVWQTNVYVKQAILLLFKFADNKVFDSPFGKGYDKIDARFGESSPHEEFKNRNLRIVPGAIIRNGVFIGSKVIIMPSFVNIGVWIDDNSMIDSMATIGSCAQIGKSCHISSCVTIGGVLEPINANPVIVEDNCFIGAGSQISEGVVVGEGSVVGAGVILTSSTKIYDKETGEVLYGAVPPYSVVVPGIVPSNNSIISLISPIIIKKVTAQTRVKTSINQMLRP
ncbi:2,3,4,5-tetrahydropyridine-2,6-carboxylate N-succinyltransferase [Candidatus Phycorickettsia trachydisci]|uniref:2,3,4,5-tetrahydropyridine-2,6-carboxylate N-succinyltransferase n=1 Tax=Candidatus Phycorickettsia trachydisci TaxID=2115978 RepID=A0A2P1P8V0_9RICK|nr:2,3,4,5-tetrahydropyridine-2,6-dicarboxylate N-succinyltransferase [Candidatus Phycorickettsia trachydisci]AVP87693.1 2,3,4,5-tetrahydropyridine-2,6-carboxylate N-succinyltransferase [Candidatus Phycorickettsia trachydisci]